MLIDRGHSILRDLRFALRSLRRSPSFVLIAVATLGLGIGANTSGFSLLNAIMLRPLPYPDSGQLDRIYRATAQNSRGGIPPADYLDLNAQAGGYGQVAAYGLLDMSLSQPGEPAETVRGLRISDNLFSTLGVEPRLGRSFRPEETLLGKHRVLILSDRFWQKRFGGDPKILGRVVRVNGEPHEIVGVLPASIQDWRHLGQFDLYRPLALTPEEAANRDTPWLRVVGRRSGSVTLAQGEAFVAEFGRRLAAEHSAINAGITWRTLLIHEGMLLPRAPAFLVLAVGLSGFVLLIACLNLANLLLARTMSRARELAVRAALGASRSKLLRPLLLESVLLSLAGGVCAVLFALWATDWMNSNYVLEPGAEGIFTVDWPVLIWAFGASLFTALVFGVAPAHFALRLDPNSTLKSGGRGTTGTRGHQRFRQGLIVGQFALAMVLLAGAALFMRGLQDLNTRGSGWETKDLVTSSMSLPPATYPSDKAVTDFQRLVLERLEALPGVASTSLSYTMPFMGLNEARKYLVAGRDAPQPGHEPAAVINGVSPRYFETLGTRLLDGRAFDGRDTLDSPRVYIVNQAMARGLFGGESPLGQRIACVGDETLEWGQIVGVVEDIQSVSQDQNPMAYQLYQPVAQEPRRYSEIAVRTTGVPPATLIDSIRATMAKLDPDLPVRQLQPADATIARAKGQLEMVGGLLSFLALLGLILASVGIYGVIARTMAQRTNEFGIRLALGAQVRDITRLVLGSGATLALIGSAIGLLGAFGLSRLFAAVFPGMRTDGVVVVSGVTLLLIGIAVLASYLPARHASRIDPIETLRAE
jgi:putative ABC transport system permease protein